MKIIIGPAAEGEHYFNRKHLDLLFWKKLKESKHLSIVAARRVGKSSFMIHLAGETYDGYHCVYLITESINEANEFFKKLYKTLIVQLNTGGKFKQFFEDLWKRLSIKKISLSEIEFGHNEIDYFEEILLLCREISDVDKRIVLLIDEFSQTVENIITDQGRDAAKNFLHQCRELCQNPGINSKISFVYAGSIGLENLVLSVGESKSINHLGELKIPPLTKEEAHGLISAIMDDTSLVFEEPCREYLLDKLSWLLPYFIQLMMSEVETICLEKGIIAITGKEIDDASNRLLENRSYFEHWLTRLRTIFKGHDFSCAKEILKIAAKQDGIDGYELNNTTEKYHVEDAQLLINILQHDGYLVKDEATGKYRFNSPLLQAWWLKNIVI